MLLHEARLYYAELHVCVDVDMSCNLTGCRSQCEMHLERFMPMNLDYPGLNILHMDPPIFSIDDFLTREECEGFIQAADGQPQGHYHFNAKHGF